MLKEKGKNRIGFTLIELLIVVAIIAILAAIAVPNFLEAQMRSKVSRVKADMRTLATAVEAYAIDFSRAPIGEQECNPANGAAMSAPFDSWDYRVHLVWRSLTTPVSYITSIPRDPFTEQSNRVKKDGSRGNYKFFNYEYLSRKWMGTDTDTWGSWQICQSSGCPWFFKSLGPSRRATPSETIGCGVAAGLAGMPDVADKVKYPGSFYDPTNGTMSFGMVVRSGRGIEPAI